MKSQHTVTVACSDGVCVVSPVHQVVRPGDTIAFHNNTTDTVRIQISDSRLCDVTIEVGGKTTTDPPAVTVPGGVYGWFPYAVWCKVNHNFAIGGSMPVIIIVRDDG